MEAEQAIASVPNHTVDPKTGFLECNGYASAFDGERKLAFLQRYKSNGLAFYRTCNDLGLHYSTVNRACKIDQVFKDAFDQAEREYIDELEATSRTNALNPKAVLERIFQLRSLRPEKYADQRSTGNAQVTINFGKELIQKIFNRQDVIEADIVRPVPLPDATMVHTMGVPPTGAVGSTLNSGDAGEGRE